MTLKTPNGVEFMVDDEDYPKIQQLLEKGYKLVSCGRRIYIRKNGKSIALCRWLMKPEKDMVVYHKDGDSTNLSRRNLGVKSRKHNKGWTTNLCKI